MGALQDNSPEVYPADELRPPGGLGGPPLHAHSLAVVRSGAPAAEVRGPVRCVLHVRQPLERSCRYSGWPGLPWRILMSLASRSGMSFVAVDQTAPRSTPKY